ncbi:penicillin-binding transpeptidase domain-containing protein [uncultured Jatrophihabitans sp.]|uniref:penicillin-binding transpeptidase domain-containing protein n=1 Tax=uncultured Jatrophihabitans sp. TaxID=1610747 RepID=UPI0035CA00E7
MNKPIRKVSIAIGVLLLALFVNLNVVQVVQGNSYRDNSQNRRVLLNEYSNPRGQITVQGTAVAESRKTTDELKYLREYPQGPVYAPVTGFYSYIYGASGIEETDNDVLSGDSPSLFTTNLTSLLTGRNPRGGRVELTINRAAQAAAYKAMRLSNGTYRPGAVVALDPSNGAILAAVSTPSYDPGALSSHDSGDISHAYACYSDIDTVRRVGESSTALKARIAKQLAEREKTSKSKGCSNVPDDPTAFLKKDPTALGPFHNRAFDVTYPPGSIFKVVVSAAALKAGVKPDDKIFAPQYYWPDDATATQKQTPCPKTDTGPCIHNFTLDNGVRETCNGSNKFATLDFALEKSCNTAFAAVANEKLGIGKIAAEAKLFGIDTTPPKIPLSTVGSTVGSVSQLARDPVALGQTAFGQRDVAITPLQAAMISSAVAQNGTLYKPHLVQKTYRPNQSVLSDPQPSQMSQVLDPGLNSELMQMMENVVTGKQAGDDATGKSAAITDIPNVVVGGKTGTADHQDANGNALPAHSWFSGFALVKGEAKIAVAVILEDSDATGGEDAAPKARQVMEAYLRSIGTD